MTTGKETYLSKQQPETLGPLKLGMKSKYNKKIFKIILYNVHV